jgi:glutamate synthase domain-containing protein 1
VKERDACGVGFIFNGNKGGKKKYGLCVAAPLAIVNECHVNIQT